MSRKGNAYSPEEILKGAIEKYIRECGYTTLQFCIHAKTFNGNAGRFDPKAVVKVVESFMDDSETSIGQIPRDLFTLADWVSVKNKNEIHARFH